jgi:hypothetical protein
LRFISVRLFAVTQSSMHAYTLSGFICLLKRRPRPTTRPEMGRSSPWRPCGSSCSVQMRPMRSTLLSARTSVCLVLPPPPPLYLVGGNQREFCSIDIFGNFSCILKRSQVCAMRFCECARVRCARVTRIKLIRFVTTTVFQASPRLVLSTRDRC